MKQQHNISAKPNHIQECSRIS